MLGSLGPAIDRHAVPWERYQQLIGWPDAGTSGRFPDFLVIAPPKTGTTWLHHNLVRQPGIYIPPNKEVRFFDLHWRSQNIAWYFAQFSAAAGKIVGDISPSYAFLPTFAIRLVRDLNPRLKLIMLMREPVARTWSQIKHGLVHGELPFTNAKTSIEDISRAELIEAFVHDYIAVGNDYKDILSRWLRYFDRSQCHVEYIENAEADPESYLKDVFRFLEVGQDISPRTLSVRDRIHVGVRRALPPWAPDLLNETYGKTRLDAERFVLATFGRRSPWPSLDHPRPPGPAPISRAIRSERRGNLASSDERLTRILDGLVESWDVSRQSAPRLVLSLYGYNIFQWREVAFGLPTNRDDICTRIKEPDDLLMYWQPGFIIRATVSEIEEQVILRQSGSATRAAMDAVERLRATLRRARALRQRLSRRRRY